MRVSPESVSQPNMLIDKCLRTCNFVNVHTIDVEKNAIAVWEALPDALGHLAPKGFFAFLLWLAALVRGDLLRRRARLADTTLTLREGATIPFPGDPYATDTLLIERVDEGCEVVLKGSNKFAEYFTNVYLEPLGPRRTRLYNVTRANFSRSLIGKLYFQGARLFHDPIVESGLRRLKQFIEAEGPASRENGGQIGVERH